VASVNEKVIWDWLLAKTGDEIGTAAIMGNLMAESSLNPACATGKNKTTNYAKDADKGAVDFENDGVAFGLVQWCFRGRKKGLMEYAKSTGRSVGHLQMQLEYMVKEMRESYKSVWAAVTDAKDLRTVSDLVMLRYEKPANTSETAKQKRAAYGLKFLREFSRITAQPAGKRMVRAKAQVNIRSGAGKSNQKVGSLEKGQCLEWLATANGWHKVAVWVSGEFSEVVS
jgi:hypothetical protein